MGDLYTPKDDPEASERISTLAERLAFKSRFVLLFGEIEHVMDGPADRPSPRLTYGDSSAWWSR